jgi:hypothetical protein
MFSTICRHTLILVKHEKKQTFHKDLRTFMAYRGWSFELEQAVMSVSYGLGPEEKLNVKT